MKIYCLLLDAVPWGCGNPSDTGTGRGGGLAGIAQRGGLTGLTQITAGMFTTTTLLSMFSGRLPSDLVTGGVGYLSHEEDRYYEWMKDEKINLIDLLKLAGFEVRLHHHLDFLLRMLLGFRGKDAVAEFEERQAEGDVRYSHVTLSGWDPAGQKLDVFSEYGDKEKCADFYKKETAYIKALQADKSPQNTFFLTQQQDWHDAWYTRDKRALGAARSRTEQWLDQWDFTEPDSVFWIFSDHGYQVGNDVTPKDALAWVLFRDNTCSPLRASRSIISSLDFYATMLHKAGLAEYCKEARDSIAMHMPASPSRVYLGEDSRVKVNSIFFVTCFTGTNVRILTQQRNAWHPCVKADARFACSSVVSCVSRWVTAEGEVSAASAAAAGAGGAVSPATLLMLVYHAQQGTVRAYRYDFLHENPYAFDAVEVLSLLALLLQKYKY